jgi:hypothetical protein
VLWSAWGRRKRFTVFTRLSAAALFKFSVSQHFFAVGSGSMLGFELDKEKEKKEREDFISRSGLCYVNTTLERKMTA